MTMDDDRAHLADELKPCPFCGGPARTFVYNGATQASCSGGHLSCAGSDVTAPLAMWNRRTPSADADLAVAEAIRRAADVGKVVGDGHYGDEVHAAIHRIAPADALAEVRRLRDNLAAEEAAGAAMIRGCRILTDDLKFRAEKAEAEIAHLTYSMGRAASDRDAALERVEKLRQQITEATDPDFIFGAMDNVNDMDVTLDQFAAAASRAIRAALDEDAK